MGNFYKTCCIIRAVFVIFFYISTWLYFKGRLLKLMCSYQWMWVVHKTFICYWSL